jgi:hypothetical protein
VVEKLIISADCELLLPARGVQTLVSDTFTDRAHFFTALGRYGANLRKLEIGIQLESNIQTLSIHAILRACPLLIDLKVNLVRGTFDRKGLTEEHFHAFER